MASNPLASALEDLRKAVLPLVKGYLLQEGPIRLGVYYQRYLQTDSKPDRKAKRSGRRYYSKANDSSELRTLYGNLQRALLPDSRFPGNITEVTTDGREVVLLSGIDTSAAVKAGPDRTTLFYAELHEFGKGGQKKRPFLEPGARDFNKEEMPKILEEIADELTRYYNGR